MARRTRQRIVESALAVVARQGYEGTKLEDIAAEAGVTRPNVYYHFPDKQSLVLAALDLFATAFRHEIIQPSLEERPDPVEAIALCGQILTDRQVTAGMAGGWLLGTLAAELSDVNEVFRARLAELFYYWTGRIEGVLHAGVHRRILVPETPVLPAARFCVSSWEGALIIARNRKELDYLQDTNRMLTVFLEGYRQAA